MCSNPTHVKKTELLLAIKEAFHQGTPPALPEGWENFTDDISATNYSEAIEETKPFWGKKWSELSLDDFNKCWCVFSFMPAESLPYFLGGYMRLSLQTEPYSNDIFELFSLFNPASFNKKRKKRMWAFNRFKISPLSVQQRVTLASYLRFMEAAGYGDENDVFMQQFLLGEVAES